MKHLKRNTDKQDFEKQVGWNLGKSHRVGMKEEIYIRIQIYICIYFPFCPPMSIVTRNPWLNPGQKKSDLGKKIYNIICVYISMLEVPPPGPRMQSWSPRWHDMFSRKSPPQKKLHLPVASIPGWGLHPPKLQNHTKFFVGEQFRGSVYL